MAVGPDQALSTPTVLLAGAGSQIGVFAIARLLAAGFDVIAISRSGKPLGLREHAQVRWLAESEATRVAADCKYLLSAGPIDLAHRLLDVCKRLQSVVVFSSTSAETKIDSTNRQESTQAKQLLNLEAGLQTAARDRGIKLVMFRPTLIYGCGLDNNISLLANWIKRFGFVPVSNKASGLRQPVHADDLASLAVKTLLSDQELPGLLVVAGGETLAYTEMLTRIFTALGKPARVLHLPGWLLVLVVRIAGLFRPEIGLNAEMVRRQAIDLVFDDSEARELLDYDPRSFNPARGDFSLPDL